MDDDLLPLSGLQHVMVCERQAALIHVDGLWRENVDTTAGRLIHARTDRPGVDVRAHARVVRSMWLTSERLGVCGIADMVELIDTPTGVRPRPIETKKGKRKHSLADRVQLCAQAICLEEKFGVAVPDGAVYYATSHRRVEVSFDAGLRATTAEAAARFRALVRQRQTPLPVVDERLCKTCSLEPVCLPKATRRPTCGGAHLVRLAAEDEP